MGDDVRMFSASAQHLGRAPSQIGLVEANISDEERARRRAELRRRELIAAGKQGFTITMPSDFDEAYTPWLVKIDDQTLWTRETGSPAEGYRPTTHVVLVHDDGSWGYLTAAGASGMPNAPRSVAELRERAEEAARTAAEHEKAEAAKFKAKQRTALPVTAATLDRLAPPTLRAAVETVERSGGRVEVKGGRVVVSLPPGEVGSAPWVGGEQAGGRAAKVCYLAEAELIETRRGDGRVSADKVPAEPLLPSGRLVPS
jgi:hypothetical protein